ncbi:hypothetical protein Fcan01_09252 [Folsomia candida]|uniref:DUF4806 domain-containing protein n=1 Tax=Folsomia candida TaxID=158441 RepID=A0A226EHM7_FOLCA|nr:hypothetical protein Fcan01_09252 [Folsomia candida]
MAQRLSTKFSVVFFPEEKSVAAVPTTWLTEEKGRIFCKWPKGPNAATVVKDGNSAPGKDWSSFPVKIYKGLGSDEYSKASANADEARTLTSPSEEEGSPSSIPTVSRANSKAQQDSSDSEAEFQANFDKDVPDKSPHGNATLNRVEERSTTPSSSPILNFNITGADGDDGDESQLNYTFTNPLTVISQGFEVNVLSYLVDIKAELSRISAQVSAIAAGCESTDTEEEFILPLNTEAQLEEIELKLHDRSARKSLLTKIVKIGGLEIKDTVERVLTAVFGQKIAEQTSLAGKSNKFAFNMLALFSIIVDAILKNPRCSNNTQKDVEIEATRWFSNAKDRDGGRDRRRKDKITPGQQQ